MITNLIEIPEPDVPMAQTTNLDTEKYNQISIH